MTILAAIQVVTALMLGTVAAALVLDPTATLPMVGGVVAAGDALVVEAAGIAAVYAALLGGLLFFDVSWWWIGLAAILAGYLAIEALVRRRFLTLLLNVTVLLAVIAALILIGSHLLEGVAIVLLAIGALLLRDNVRELRTSIRPG